MPLAVSRYQEALKLLTQETTSIEKFESIKTILAGQNEKLDRILENCTGALLKIDNLAKGDVISLVADAIPAKSEEEKRRKKAILLFIKYTKELKTEVERINTQLGQKNTNQTGNFAKIFALAKGPLGIITILALLIALALVAARSVNTKSNVATNLTPQPSASPKQTIEIINFKGKQVPTTELRIGTGSDCDSPHYHAKNEIAAIATDGTQIPDPGGCGYGKLKDTPRQQIAIY